MALLSCADYILHGISATVQTCAGRATSKLSTVFPSPMCVGCVRAVHFLSRSSPRPSLNLLVDWRACGFKRLHQQKRQPLQAEAGAGLERVERCGPCEMVSWAYQPFIFACPGTVLRVDGRAKPSGLLLSSPQRKGGPRSGRPWRRDGVPTGACWYAERWCCCG